MVVFRFRNGIGPGYYQKFGLWRKTATADEKWNVIGSAEYRRRLLYINPPDYRKMSQNKIAEKALLALYGIPSPRFFGHLHHDTGRACDGAQLRDAADLARLIRALGVSRFCIKDPEGHNGHRLLAVEVVASAPTLRLKHLLEDRTGSVGELWSRFDLHKPPSEHGWLIEEYLQQHPWYAQFNPSTVNTVRVLALRRGPEVAVLGGYFCIGRRGFLANNDAASARLVSPVDVQRGTIGPSIDAIDGYEFSHHPDTGLLITGRELPYWAEAKALASTALSRFPAMRFAGIDIAIGPAGPLVLELNVVPSHSDQGYAKTPYRAMLR